MREIPTNYRLYPTEGLLFRIATACERMKDGPSGVWIERDFAKQNPVLRTVSRNGVLYKFVVEDPLFGVSESSLAALLQTFTEQPVTGERGIGRDAKVDLYAEVVEEIETTREKLEAAVGCSPEPPELIHLGETLARTGYELTCEFINILRRSHSQYWLTHPHAGSLGWGWISYYSQPRGKWHVIELAQEFGAELMKPDMTGGTPRGPILLGMVTSGNANRLQEETADREYTFADEMVSTALVELGAARIRSAIVHAIIGLESASKRTLDRLIEQKLPGFEKGATTEAISKQLSTVELARLVLAQLAGEEVVQGVDWDAVQQLYDIRNEIIHRSRKRLPEFERLKRLILEIMNYVNSLESRLASVLRSG